MITLRRRGQATLELVFLIVIITAALITMQSYVKRAMQGRIRASITKINEDYTYPYNRLKLNPVLLMAKTDVDADEVNFALGGEKSIYFGYAPKQTESSLSDCWTKTEIKENSRSVDDTVTTKNDTNGSLQKRERLLPYARKK